MTREVKKLVENAMQEPFSKAKRLLLGPLITWGQYRRVFELKQDPRYVVKVEMDLATGQFCNISEFRNCINYMGTPLVPWLADITHCSTNGVLLIQRRIVHKPKEFYPDKIPSVFIDLKYTNFGWIGDKFVCCDYPFLQVFTQYKLVPVKWKNPKYLRDELSNAGKKIK